MVVVEYSVFITSYITREQCIEYSNFICKTLTDPRGWCKSPYCYNFVEVSNCEAMKNPRVIKVRFITNKGLTHKYGNGINNLSCYVPDEHAVYFNLKNWNKGGWEGCFPPKDSIDGLTRYRQYVVNHEFGHALGLQHPNCQSGPTSVMEQGTKGLTWLNRCLPNNKKNREYVCWPQDVDIYNEEKGSKDNKTIYKINGGGVYRKRNTMLICFMLTLVLVAVIFIIARVKQSFIGKSVSNTRSLN